MVYDADETVHEHDPYCAKGKSGLQTGPPLRYNPWYFTLMSQRRSIELDGESTVLSLD